MDFIVDTDIASILSKIGEITLLKRVFPCSKYYVTLETIKELESAKELGFDYTDIIDVMDVVDLDQKILKKSKKITENNKKLHLTEVCSILVCKKKGMIMVTNDKVAKNFCEKNNVVWIGIVELLRFGFLNGEISENEGWKIVKKIEKKDKTKIKNAERIFKRLKFNNTI